jgi:diaminopimelate epimerase
MVLDVPVLFAYNKDIINKKTVFHAFDGIHNAEILDNGLIKMEMKVNSDIVTNSFGTWLDTGSPHLIIEKDDTDKLDVNNEGKLIRYNDFYREEGVNVNFVEKISDNQFKIRTYERGVENETLACGTGSTASAICMNFLGKTNSSNITMQCKGGDLNVQFNSSEKDYKEISITGPAKLVFEGIIEIKI